MASPFSEVENTPTAIRLVSIPFDVPAPRGAAVCLFLTTPLPEGAASSIHVSVDGGPFNPVPNMLSNTSPSAIFRIAPGGSAAAPMGVDTDMMADDMSGGNATAKVTIGLSIEPIAAIETLLAGVPKPAPGGQRSNVDTFDLAYKIASKLISDFQDFAMSFASGPSSGSGSMIPMKVTFEGGSRMIL